MMAVAREVELTLRSFGMRYSRKRRYWYLKAADVKLCDIDLEKLKLWEVDQVLAGVRDGENEISLGPRKSFRIR